MHGLSESQKYSHICMHGLKCWKSQRTKLSFIDMHFILSYNYHPTVDPFPTWSSLAIDLNRRKNYTCVHRTLIIDYYWFLHYNFQHMAECTLLNPCDRHSHTMWITQILQFNLLFHFAWCREKKRKKTGCRICINLVTIKHLILFTFSDAKTVWRFIRFMSVRFCYLSCIFLSLSRSLVPLLFPLERWQLHHDLKLWIFRIFWKCMPINRALHLVHFISLLYSENGRTQITLRQFSRTKKKLRNKILVPIV